MTMDKTFDAAEAEARLYKGWEDAGCFKAGANAKPGGTPFCIVIPPPNVTGNLHMGHAFNNTLQDILTRWHRMRGDDTLWQPGTDHAGIATQMVVERKLAADGEPSRRELGREKFLEKVWEWKEESGGNIANQLRRLGASCDWSRERFTMDEGLSSAVRKIFVDLYDKGLIYRDKRLVNWDPHFETAISDIEVENRETPGHMWHFKYPLAGGATYEYIEKDEDGNITLRETRDYISIATTRPETMLGDGAVAVHPGDERYAPIVGTLCEIPVGPKELRRLIPIITDEYPDPDFGSGAVKITGAHDFNDYQVAKRGGIPLYNLMDTKARMRADGLSYEDSAAVAGRAARGEDVGDVSDVNLVPPELRGLDRYEARERVIAAITEEGLAVMTDGEDGPVPLVENKPVMQPFGDRSNVVIEPYLTDQWFVDAETLAQPALAAVRDGTTTFHPKSWEKTYFQWLENIEPWCISRQLWWGHQVPVWYGPDGTPFCAEDETGAQALAERHYGAPSTLTRDPDVLDTWFSSALWPFSTLGWPDDTPELKKYYPTSVLSTGFDIIFFWVARMMMFGLHAMKDIPFPDVYMHALVRDEQGQKMSKSKGNVIDPLVLVDQYGADAVRMTLTSMAAMGRDLKLATSRVEGYRNFGTKLWNAARFCEMNECRRAPGFDPGAVEQTLNKWIVGETARARMAADAALGAYRFNDYANGLYAHVWGVFCDWYLELAKPLLTGEDEGIKAETRATAAWALDEIITLLHPITPFITEEIWRVTGGEGTLMHRDWPAYGDDLINTEADTEIRWAIKLIEAIRSIRAEMNVPPSAQVELVLTEFSMEAAHRLLRQGALIRRLARLSEAAVANEAPRGSIAVAIDEATVNLPLAGVIDVAKERARLEKSLAKAQKEQSGLGAKLANEKFLAKAPEAVVTEQRERLETVGAEVERLRGAIDRLAALDGA